MGRELRKSRLLAPSGRGRVFTQFLTHKSAHLSTLMDPRIGSIWPREHMAHKLPNSSCYLVLSGFSSPLPLSRTVVLSA